MSDSFPSQSSVTFEAAVVRAHIRQHHPLCPPVVAEALVRRISRRVWSDIRLGHAFGLVSAAYVRHTMTNYDPLLKAGLTREEARNIVNSQCHDIIGTWSFKPDPTVAETCLGGGPNTQEPEMHLAIRFTRGAVHEQIEAQYPDCPAELKTMFEDAIVARPWRHGSLEKTLSYIAYLYVREFLTPYRTLVEEGESRKKARRAVAPLVGPLLTLWKTGKPCPAME